MPLYPSLPLLLLFAILPCPFAQVVPATFRDCSSAPPQIRINITSVFAQFVPRAPALHFTLLGTSPAQILYSSNTSNPLLSTVFAPTSILTFTLNFPSQSHAFCDTLRPPSPLPPLANDSITGYCPLAPGPLAFAVTTPLAHPYELVTLNTQIRVLDTSQPAQELACVFIPATPLHPGAVHSVYGHAAIIFWFTVALALAFWLVIGTARLAAAWFRGRQRVHRNLWSRVQRMGFVLASAISGERFAVSPALMRFGTPSMRDVIFHTQWCTLLAMLTVQWPPFVYPYLAQTAWASLLYNVSFNSAGHWDPLYSIPFNPPDEFADQLADPTSPLFLNSSIPNTLFTLPPGLPSTGIPALASTVGIRPQDAFSVVVGLFVLILAGTIVLSVGIFAVDTLIGSILRTSFAHWSATSHKEFGESPEPVGLDDDLGTGNVRYHSRPPSRAYAVSVSVPRGWLSHRLGQTSFHSSVLHGNLVRLLMLFHFPVTVFSCYQFSSGKSHGSLTTIILAALAFAIFSVSIPIWLLVRVFTTPTSKLYDETRTLLMLGPLYNQYAHGSQLFASLFFGINIAYGVALGCGQQSGTAQSIIILVIEVASALTTSVWLPWGRGATMGGISFLLCVTRIITAVLLVILSPVVSVGDAASGWIAYAILLIQGLVYVGFALILISKLTEGAVRLAWDVSFDRSKHTIDTGLIGTIALAGCCLPRRKPPHAERRADARRANRPSVSDSATTTQNMLLPPAVPVSHTMSPPPSVIRPEQLNQPYREESDDEGGYILGAWHYEDDSLPSPPLPPPPPPPVSPQPESVAAPAGDGGVAPTSGFSRVAGGRAKLESPYTMASEPGGAGMQTGVSRASRVTDARAGNLARGLTPTEGTAAEDEERPPPRRSRFWRLGADTFRGLARRRQEHAAAPTTDDERQGDDSGGVGEGDDGGGGGGGGGHTFVVIRDRTLTHRNHDTT